MASRYQRQHTLPRIRAPRWRAAASDSVRLDIRLVILKISVTSCNCNRLTAGISWSFAFPFRHPIIINLHMPSSSILAIFGALCLAYTVNSVPTPGKAPHLVFVLIDDMGFNDFYQSQDLAAAWPTVATLAKKDCVLLSQYYTQQLCTPSRAAFMTGGPHPLSPRLQ